MTEEPIPTSLSLADIETFTFFPWTLPFPPYLSISGLVLLGLCSHTPVKVMRFAVQQHIWNARQLRAPFAIPLILEGACFVTGTFPWERPPEAAPGPPAAGSCAQEQGAPAAAPSSAPAGIWAAEPAPALLLRSVPKTGLGTWKRNQHKPKLHPLKSSASKLRLSNWNQLQAATWTKHCKSWALLCTGTLQLSLTGKQAIC